MRLRLESADGLRANDYRIRDGLVQVRSVDGRGRPGPGFLGRWRSVHQEDLALHYALETAVSQWLRVRLGREQRSVKVKAAQ